MQASTYYDLDEGFDTDPADRWDADAFEPRDIANYDYTASIPPLEGTFDPREDAYGEDEAYADMMADVYSDRAFAEALERRAENGTWWGR